MGATVDFAILNFLLSPPAGHEHPEFLMEVSVYSAAMALLMASSLTEGRPALLGLPFQCSFLLPNSGTHSE